MIYRFIDERGTFVVENPSRYNAYFPLTNKDGTLLSSISPNLAGDIKKDNEHFLTPPASIEDIRSNPLCRREFFIKIPTDTMRLSYLYDDILEVGFLYHKLTKRIKMLQVEILNFIPHSLDVEIIHIKIINKSNNTIQIVPTSFIPLYGRAEKNLRDHRHVCSLLNRITLDRYGIFLKPTMIFDERGHSVNKMIYFALGFDDKGKPPIGQFPTLDYFYGRGDIIFPDAIEKDVRPILKKLPEFDGKECCAAFRFQVRRLKKYEEANYCLIMGMSENEQKIKDTYNRLNSAQKINESFKSTKQYWQEHLSSLEFDFKDRDFNNWLKWVKFQPTLRKLFGCSFLPHFDYGKGGRGWRDLWQDTLTLTIMDTQKALPLILNNFRGVRPDGTNATIITKDGDFIPDRNRISRVWRDHGVWPYLTTKLYINKTGDLSILLKEIDYFQDIGINKQNYKGTVLEHILLQALVQFFNVGNHNIIRLQNADWNDGLDMAPKEGESVTFSFMYAHNLKDLCLLLERLRNKIKNISLLKETTILLDRINAPLNYSNYKEKQMRLKEYLNQAKCVSGRRVDVKIDDLIYDLKEKSRHLFEWLRTKEWLKNEGFFNGYYDNRARGVEGVKNGIVRMMLQTQVFAIMSGAATNEQIKKIWVSCKRYLQDKTLGGFHLNTNFKSLYLDLGRAFGFSYGDKENGAFFNHMVVMFASALYKRGFIKEGFEAINSIYKMAVSKNGEIYPMIPEYFNNEGKGLYLYLTGSASWYIWTLIDEILGIKFDMGDIVLAPKLIPYNFYGDDIEVKFSFQGKDIRAIFIRKTKESKIYTIKEAFLENIKILNQDDYGYRIRKEELRKIKKKEVNIKIYLSNEAQTYGTE